MSNNSEWREWVERSEVKPAAAGGCRGACRTRGKRVRASICSSREQTNRVSRRTRGEIGTGGGIDWPEQSTALTSASATTE